MFSKPHLSLRPCATVLCVITAAYAVALLTVVLMECTVLGKCLLILLLLPGFYYDLQRFYWLRTPNAVVFIAAHEDYWLLQTAKRRQYKATLAARSVVLSSLLCLQFRCLKTKRLLTVFLLQSALSAKEWRHLQVYLRYQ